MVEEAGMSSSTNNIAVIRTFATVVAECPKCYSEYTASDLDATKAAAKLGRTCGAISCDAYVDSPHMVLTDRGWVDNRGRKTPFEG